MNCFEVAYLMPSTRPVKCISLISSRHAGTADETDQSPRRPFACLAAFSLNRRDRKSTRLNSSHLGISYAVFCLKKKKTKNIQITASALAYATWLADSDAVDVIWHSGRTAQVAD